VRRPGIARALDLQPAGASRRILAGPQRLLGGNPPRLLAKRGGLQARAHQRPARRSARPFHQRAAKNDAEEISSKFENRSSNEIPNLKFQNSKANQLTELRPMRLPFEFRASSFIRISNFELRI